MADTYARITWDETGKRFYETGVDRCVLYVADNNNWYGKGVGWNGITAVNESPSGGEATALYADNIKYLNLMSNEEFGATIEAYTYPDEFAECDGTKAMATGVFLSQQPRKKFAFTYRTMIGNDVDGTDKGYKIHLVYGAQAAPSEKSHPTINDSPEAVTFSWTVTTTPIEVPNFKPTAHIIIDSTKVDSAKLTQFENYIYGKATVEQVTGNDPTMPTISKLVEIFGSQVSG